MKKIYQHELFQKQVSTYIDHLHVHTASEYHRETLNQGNKILLPASALQQLIYFKQNGPMMFKLKSMNNQKFTFVGVLEFVAEEGTCIVPDWIFENMGFFDDCIVEISLQKSLPQGKLIKIQPHETAFVELPDPRAILENHLRNYICLTQGETIAINFHNTKYMIDIVKVEPENPFQAVCINEADVEIDFLQPLDYSEEPKLVKKISLGVEDELKEQNGLKVFTGQGVRLDGKQGVPVQRKQSEDVKIAEPYNPRKNRLPNGIRQTEEIKVFQGSSLKLGNLKKQL